MVTTEELTNPYCKFDFPSETWKDGDATDYSWKFLAYKYHPTKLRDDWERRTRKTWNDYTKVVPITRVWVIIGSNYTYTKISFILEFNWDSIFIVHYINTCLLSVFVNETHPKNSYLLLNTYKVL